MSVLATDPPGFSFLEDRPPVFVVSGDIAGLS